MSTVATNLVPSAQRSYAGGLGQSWYEYIPLWPSEREEDPCAASPVWCGYTPFSDFINECHPIDVERCARRMMGPEMTEENKRLLMDELTRTQQTYQEMNPEGARAYQDWLANRKFYELDTGYIGDRLEWTGYAMLMAAAVAGIIILRG